MASLQAWNGAYDGVGVGIEYFEFRAIRDIDSPRRGINGDVVKIFPDAGSRTERNEVS
jgi:hypothetical protein